MFSTPSKDFEYKCLAQTFLGRRCLFVSCEKSPCFKKVILFLHGLKDAYDPHSEIKEMVLSLKGEDILLAFPEGLQGAFPKQSEKLAWGPSLYVENLSYIRQLLKFISSTYDSEKYIAAGFSNGAFFLADLLRKENLPFTGYWLQGGGIKNNEVRTHDLAKKPKVVIEVGRQDEWHLASVKSLKNQLIEASFIPGVDLLYRELCQDHTLDLSHFKEDIDFLFSED